MIKNKIIIIPTDENVFDICDFIYQTSLILSQKNKIILLATNKHRTLKNFISSLIHTHSPFSYKNRSICEYSFVYFIPQRINKKANFKFTKINATLNELFLKSYLFLKKEKVIIWMFFPRLEKNTKFLFNKRFTIVYDLVDFFKEIKWIDPKKIDLIFCNSQSLKKKIKQQVNFAKKHIQIVPQGFNLKTFEKNQKIQKHNLVKKSKTIGFVGAISNRLNFKLLFNLAQKNKQWKFLFVGPIKKDPKIKEVKSFQYLNKLLKLKNVIYKKRVVKSKLPHIIKNIDIGIIPYNTSLDFNRYCYPMKLIEYFYMGKPVISTPIEELTLPKFKNLVTIADTAEEWEKQIKRLLKKPWLQKYKKQQQQMAIDNSWENKISIILKTIENYEVKQST